MNEYDTLMEDEIICPWCGYVIDSCEYDGSDDGTTIECPECEKKMDLRVEYSMTFTTKKPKGL